MCCFARWVQSVSNTRIFARLTGNGTQYLVYQMDYESDEPNAMILPLPVKLPVEERDVRFVDLSDYESFFSDLVKGFPYIAPASIGCGARQTLDSALKVVKVGNYVATFVPSVDDFERLDPRFVIPRKTWEKLPQYADYGFAVFQLEELSGHPHPMAFEFASQTDDVFFPTVHIHDGEVHSTEAFDHSLYMQHAGLDSRVGRYRNRDIRDSTTGFVRSQEVASNFCMIEKSQGILVDDLLVHRVDLRGSLDNADQIYAIQGDPLKKGFNWRSVQWLAPIALIVGCLGWIIGRRNRLGGSNAE